VAARALRAHAALFIMRSQHNADSLGSPHRFLKCQAIPMHRPQSMPEYLGGTWCRSTEPSFGYVCSRNGTRN